MTDESLSAMQKEWRDRVAKDIERITVGIDDINRRLSTYRDEFVKQRDHDELREQVQDLRADRQKFTGIIIALQIVGGVVLWLAGKLWK